MINTNGGSCLTRKWRNSNKSSNFGSQNKVVLKNPAHSWQDQCWW
jgi:hypothetical protein